MTQFKAKIFLCDRYEMTNVEKSSQSPVAVCICYEIHMYRVIVISCQKEDNAETSSQIHPAELDMDIQWAP